VRFFYRLEAEPRRGRGERVTGPARASDRVLEMVQCQHRLGASGESPFSGRHLGEEGRGGVGACGGFGSK
jgi:hypothetical protein